MQTNPFGIAQFVSLKLHAKSVLKSRKPVHEVQWRHCHNTPPCWRYT